MQNAGRYDGYDRHGPRNFVGEYAAQSDRIGSPKNQNNLLPALSEACFMTGIERNADVVARASYAPLFAEVNGWQWTPNLIWFNNSRSYRTPNYYVQQLFSLNKGTALLSLARDGMPVAGQDKLAGPRPPSIQPTHELILKIVNVSKNQHSIQINLSDAHFHGPATLQILGGTSLSTTNSFDNTLLQPITITLPTQGRSCGIPFATPIPSLSAGSKVQ